MSQKVERAIDENPAYEDALAIIQRELDESDSVEWDDVEDEITSGQWGRLIQLGVLEEADSGDGYVLYDEDAVDDKVTVSAGFASTASSTGEDSTEEDDSGGWSRYDVIALAIAGFFTVGYAYDPIRNVVGSTLHLVLGPLDAILPFFAVVAIVATMTAAYTTFLQSRLMDGSRMKEVQAKMDRLKERRKEAKEKDDEQALQRIEEEQKDAMAEYPKVMKEQFRPMVWIAALTLPVFLWMFWVVQTGQIAAGEQVMVLPLIGETSWTATIGPFQTWIVWYLLISLGMSQVIQKVFGIDMTPT